VKALAGKRILIGRAAKQAGALSDLLREQGATVIDVPFIEIKPPKSYGPLDHAIRELRRYDWLILTSVNGVEVFFSRLQKLKSANLSGLRVAAIGPATRVEIERHGLRVDVMPREYVAESVVRALRSKVKRKRVLLVRASVARDVIPRELRKAGARVDVVEAYRTVLPRGSADKIRKLLRDPKRRPHAITFTSSSTVKNFVRMAGKTSLGEVLLASIGPVTSATLLECGLPADVEAKEYSMPGLVAAIEGAFTTKGTKVAPGYSARS
jgi:uroporphyrinogen-III synthase